MLVRSELPFAFKRSDLVWVALVVVVAALLRVGRPDVLHFQYDQATQSILAQEMATGAALPLLGPESSSGIPHSPMSVYQLVPAYALTRSPYAVTLAIGLWNVVGVVLLWGLVHRYVHPRVAIVAALFYAVNPYAVRWSRAIWVPTSLTPFVLAGLLLFLLGYVEGKRSAQVAALPVFLIGVQTHHAAWLLVLLAAWIVWQGVRHPDRRSRIDPRMVALGLVLGALVVLPYAIGLVQHYSGQWGALTDGMGADTLRLRAKVWDRYLPLVTGIGSEMLAGDAAPELLAVNPLPVALWAISGGLALIGLLTVWLRRENRPLGVALLLWIVLPPLVFWPNWSGVYWHFFIPCVPGMALAAGLGAYWLAEVALARWQSISRVVVYGLVALIVLSQGVWYWRALDWVNTHYTPGGFSTPLRMSMAVRDAVLDVDDVLILGGQSSYSGYQVWKALLFHDASSVREVVVNGGNVAVFPSGPFAVITAPRAAPYPVTGLYDTDDVQVFPLRPAASTDAAPEGAYRVDQFAAAPEWPGPVPGAIPPRTFANGVQVTGFVVDGGQLYTEWRLPAASDGDAPQYRYFAHLLDASGDRVAGQDFDFWAAKYWREGDRLLLWGPVDVPPEAVTLRLGMYGVGADGAINGLDAYDSAGTAAPWVDVPLAGG